MIYTERLQHISLTGLQDTSKHCTFFFSYISQTICLNLYTDVQTNKIYCTNF